jgi:hypothetical protein
MVVAFSACGKGPKAAPSSPEASGNTEAGGPSGNTIKYTDEGKRIITIGTWYDRYYVSKHQSIYDDPDMADPETALIRLNKMRTIEEKYNIVLNYVNLTFDGIRESIDTSIPTGTPDVDIYEVDLQFGIPAVLNNYGIALERMGLADTDVFGPQAAMKYLRLSGQDEAYLFAPSVSGGANAYVLAFNADMIRAAGLENPQDLYDRGEWTWAKWREYLLALTRDPGDEEGLKVYGYSGYWTSLLTNLLFSNNTGIAPGEREQLSSPATREVLDFINTIYNVDKTARPWDSSNWEINNKLYAQGLSGFWIGADWIFNEQGGGELPFKIGVVPWPRGPGGSFEENRHSQPQGNWYFIPRGVGEPRLVYDVIYDWVNWYDGDLALGVDNEWSKAKYMTERNFGYASMMASKPGFDMWESLGTNFNLLPMLSAEKTPDEIVEENRQLIQDALDNYFTQKR